MFPNEDTVLVMRRPVLIAGQWRPASAADTFHAADPNTGQLLADAYPISRWEDCQDALQAAVEAAAILSQTPGEQIARFLNGYAARIEARQGEIVELAHRETALAISPRLASVELPRTCDQLRQAAAAAAEGAWALATIDAKNNIRSRHAAIGPVVVIGPNNFPLAFNGVSGGDFAAAIAAGNPVIAKAHPSHPGTTRLLAEEALAAVTEARLPPGTVQMIYHLSRQDGLRLAADRRVGATAFTGSRSAGLALKAAADAAGRAIYLEMSSLNPVVILPGALRERAEKIAGELADSCLAASGQFCTKPGLVLLISGEESESFLTAVGRRLADRPAGPLLSAAVGEALGKSLRTLLDAGAEVLVGGEALPGASWRYANTLLRVDGERFLADAEALQTEAFGNAMLAAVARDVNEACKIVEAIHGQLTGCIYSDAHGADDADYAMLAPPLRRRVGRLLNDKMPTGVAVSPAMNHGGPYPATGHPGFTAVGIPASLRRFSRLECYDNVRPDRLPTALRQANP
jgi:NADP-dependent aldehyde dehydrogenase